MKPLLILTAMLSMSSPALADTAQPDQSRLGFSLNPDATSDVGGQWTGGSAGVSISALDFDGVNANGDDGGFGLHVGYDYDFGRFVLGTEIEIDGTDLSLGIAGTVDSIARLKIRGGYDLGQTLLYVTGGVADVETTIGSDTGGFVGVGVTYQLNDRFYVGGEILQSEFNTIGQSGVSVDATSIAVRGGVRF